MAAPAASQNYPFCDAPVPPAPPLPCALVTAHDGSTPRSQQTYGEPLLFEQAVGVKFQRRAHGAVAEQRAHGFDVHAQFQQPRGEAVAKRVEVRALDAHAAARRWKRRCMVRGSAARDASLNMYPAACPIPRRARSMDIRNGGRGTTRCACADLGVPTIRSVRPPACTTRCAARRRF